MRRLVVLASLAIPASAVATEAEIELRAEATFDALTGNLDHKLDDDEDSSDGFRQKTEFELAARYRDVARALRWGLISTLEGELDGFTWTPKAFVFIQGPPGVSLGLELSRFDEADGSHDSGSILLFSLDAAFLVASCSQDRVGALSVSRATWASTGNGGLTPPSLSACLRSFHGVS